MRVAFITMNKFPDGDAGSLRQSALAKACLKSGMEVFIVGLGNGDYKKVLSYNGLKYTTLRNLNMSNIEKMVFYNNFGKEAISLLYDNNFIPDCIIVTMLFKKPMKQILNYSKLTNCKIIYDCVEWYSPSEFKMCYFDPNYMLNNAINKNFIDNRWKVISISSYLNDYFSKKGIKTIRLPVIFDLEKSSAIYSLPEYKIIISYVGSPGKKDNLKNILIALSLLNKEQLDKFELRIVGVDKDELLKKMHIDRGLFNRIDGSLNIFGRLPHEKAINIVKNSNFSILIRDEKERFAKAGFPTKVVESLCCGTPMICNLSSDLGIYLKDNYNSVIIDDLNPSSIKSSLVRIINIDCSHYEKLRINARLTAEKFFNCENYSAIIKDFLEEN